MCNIKEGIKIKLKFFFIRSFDIARALVKPRIMEDYNESLQTMGFNKNFHDDNGNMDIEVKEDKTLTID